jgi:hypothetical protein
MRWVSQLMKLERCEWDEQMINECLYPHDADEVLKIRMTETDNDDFIAWHYEKSEVFSMRSAYRPALEREQA